MRLPSGKRMKAAVSKEILQELGDLVSNNDVQTVCDEAGISTKGYKAIFQLLKDALRERGIMENFFPAPHKVSIAKKITNEDVLARLGTYLHIEDTMPAVLYTSEVPKTGRGKGKKSTSSSPSKGFPYTKWNNIFVDLRRLQQAMIKFYELPQEGSLMHLGTS